MHIAKYEDFRVEQGGRLGELWGYKSNGFYTVYDAATGKGDLVLNYRYHLIHDSSILRR